MTATARLLAGLAPEVLAVPDDGTGAWRLVLLVGPELPDGSRPGGPPRSWPSG